MVIYVLPMGLDATRRRLVVGRELRLLQMAWSARRSPALSARAASVLVVPASLPASLSSANSHADATVQKDSHAPDPNNPDPDTDETNADTAKLDAAASDIHRKSSRGSANADAYLHRSAGGSDDDADTDIATGSPRHGDPRKAHQTETNSQWNDDARPTDGDAWGRVKRHENSDQDESARERDAHGITCHE
jgi:hypothetical protein